MRPAHDTCSVIAVNVYLKLSNPYHAASDIFKFLLLKTFGLLALLRAFSYSLHFFFAQNYVVLFLGLVALRVRMSSLSQPCNRVRSGAFHVSLTMQVYTRNLFCK